ncbi:MAG: homing endonuclease associated repeat-containing protein [Terracidiphilus sp.]
MTEPIFKLTHVPGVPVSDEDLIADLRRVAREFETESVSAREYQSLGQYSHTTQLKRFGTWNEALRRAGLKISNRLNIPDEELFENILILWQHFGRQPRRREVDSSPSTISQQPYNRRFGSWMNALRAFVIYANGAGAEPSERQIEAAVGGKHKTGRDPSLRLRWRVLQRDNFKCCACGASPAIIPGVELHVDHIHPWEKGGETVFENLQTLCSKCNLGKSNLLPS